MNSVGKGFPAAHEIGLMMKRLENKAFLRRNSTVPRSKEHGTRAEWVIAIATCFLVATSLIAGLLVYCQLGELRRQSSNMENTLKQSFRPVGIVSYANETKPRMIIVSKGASQSHSSPVIKFDPMILNNGSGTMFYLGSITFASLTPVNFHDDFLSGSVEEVTYDRMPTTGRGFPILTGCSDSTGAILPQLYYDTLNHIHSLFLYADQSGSVYSTERADVLKFERLEPDSKGNFIPKLRYASSRQVLRTYTHSKLQSLVRAIDRKNHDFAALIQDIAIHDLIDRE